MGLSKLFPRSKRFGRYNMTYLDEHLETEVDCVVGAFMMVRREAIDRVGLLDETFWMYGEDIDWAFRIKAGRLESALLPDGDGAARQAGSEPQNPRTRRGIPARQPDLLPQTLRGDDAPLATPGGAAAVCY